MIGVCPSSRAYMGIHDTYVDGAPRNSMTWYVCRLCGRREKRGAGAFYRPSQDGPTPVVAYDYPVTARFGK